MSAGQSIAGVLDDPVLDRLIAALCQACEAFLQVEPGIFAVAMTENQTGGIEVFHASVMDSLHWFQSQVDVDAALEAGLAEGQFLAVGNCVNISYQDTRESDDVPVLAIHVLSAPGKPIHVRVYYELRADGTVRFGQPTVVTGSDIMPN